MEVLSSPVTYEGFFTPMFANYPTSSYHFNGFHYTPNHYENRNTVFLKRKHDFMDVIDPATERPTKKVSSKTSENLIEKIHDIFPESPIEVDPIPQTMDNTSSDTSTITSSSSTSSNPANLGNQQLILYRNPPNFLDKEQLLKDFILSSTTFLYDNNFKSLVPISVSKPSTSTVYITTPDNSKLEVENAKDGFARVVWIESDDETEDDDGPRIVEITEEEEKEILAEQERKKKEALAARSVGSIESMDLD